MRLTSLRFALAALLSLATTAHAQDYPNKPVRLIVSFAPGGPVDVIARLLAQKLNEKLGQSFIVENRAGAGGNIAAKAVAALPADGYVLLVTSSALAVNQSLYKEPGYDALKDFTPVALAASSPNILIAHPSLPANNLREFLRDMKGKPVSYGSAGVGSTPHLTGDNILRVLGGLDAVHIPFQGAAPAVTAVLGGQPPLASIALPPAVAQIKAGKLKGLAVTSLKRIPALPDVPTVAESGFADFEDYTWVGVFAPTGLPAPIVARLNSAINEALRSTDVKEKLAASGFEGNPGTPEEFAAYLRRELTKWGGIVKSTGITAQ